MCVVRMEQQYRFVYFNEMNLAVKSPMLTKRSPHFNITLDTMRLLTEVHTYTLWLHAYWWLQLGYNRLTRTSKCGHHWDL